MDLTILLRAKKLLGGR